MAWDCGPSILRAIVGHDLTIHFAVVNQVEVQRAQFGLSQVLEQLRPNFVLATATAAILHIWCPPRPPIVRRAEAERRSRRLIHAVRESARGLLLMLERAGQISLPPVSYVRHNPLARARPEPVLIDTKPIESRLRSLAPRHSTMPL